MHLSHPILHKIMYLMSLLVFLSCFPFYNKEYSSHFKSSIWHLFLCGKHDSLNLLSAWTQQKIILNSTFCPAIFQDLSSLWSNIVSVYYLNCFDFTFVYVSWICFFSIKAKKLSQAADVQNHTRNVSSYMSNANVKMGHDGELPVSLVTTKNFCSPGTNSAVR